MKNDPLCDMLIGRDVLQWVLCTDNMFVDEYDDDDDIFLSDTLNTEQNVRMHCDLNYYSFVLDVSK